MHWGSLAESRSKRKSRTPPPSLSLEALLSLSLSQAARRREGEEQGGKGLVCFRRGGRMGIPPRDVDASRRANRLPFPCPAPPALPAPTPISHTFTLHTSHFTLHARSHARHSCTWTPPRQGFPSFPCLLQPRTTPLNGRSTTSTACLLLLRLMMRNNNKAAQTQTTTTSPTTIQQQQQQQQHLRRRNNRSSLRGTGLRATSRRGNGASST